MLSLAFLAWSRDRGRRISHLRGGDDWAQRSRWLAYHIMWQKPNIRNNHVHILYELFQGGKTFGIELDEDCAWGAGTAVFAENKRWPGGDGLDTATTLNLIQRLETIMRR
jgi:hypothetical protein